MLNANGSFDTWSFFVDSDPPVYWELQQSTDSGVTWTQTDQITFPNDIIDAVASGTWVQAQRDDGGGVPYGPTSNIIVVP